MIHCLEVLNGYEREISVGNTLITSYFKCGCLSSGRQVFDEMFERNVVTWKDRARAIKRMKEMGLVKEIGVSSIEIEKNVYSFVVEDRNHPQAEAIYGLSVSC
ncbi:hypothetical protein SLE2022_322730 [Rubroshorea leprosula]